MKLLTLWLSLTLIVTGTIQAQVCNGVLGAPILNLTFGQGTATQNAYSPLSAYAPGMSSGTSLQPSGLLGAANTSGLVKSASTFGSPPSWVSSSDHTGNPYGLFFGMNMPDNAGGIVLEYMMNDLCPNTTLEYSIWLLNLMAPTNPYVGSSLVQYPNVTMRILDLANNILAQQSTGNVPIDAVWHQFSMLFSNGSNTSVKLQLINNTVGSSYGNDLALDDITIRPCIPDAGISPLLDTTLCATTSLTFNANITSGVYTPPNYQWQYSIDGGSTWTNSGPAGPGSSFNFTFNTSMAPAEYRIRYLVSPQGITANTNCHAVSDTSIIRIDSIKKDFLNPAETTVCNGTSIILDAGSANASAYLWNTGATTSSISVNTPGQYWAQAVSPLGCKATDTSKVTGYANTPVDLGPDRVLCEGTLLNLQSLTAPGTATPLWNTGATTAAIQVNSSGKYWLQFSQNGCIASDTVQVVFNEFPEVDLGPDLSICAAGRVVLKTGKTYPEGLYVWSNGSSSESIEVGQGQYWLKITNLPDCSSSDTITISVQRCDCAMSLPSAFSPNGDGLNDEFYPVRNKDCPVHAYSFQVYNRWGERVFHTSSPMEKWNGLIKNVSADLGTYYYYIRFTEDATGETRTYKGDVTLIR